MVESNDVLRVAVTIVAATALVTLGVFTALLRDVSLDPPASTTSGRRRVTG